MGQKTKENIVDETSLKYYAGIGSRETPPEILEMMTKIAEGLSRNYILRSGGAAGADTAFEKGSQGQKIIYLPWTGFNNSKEKFIDISTDAMLIAKEFHPNWQYLSYAARKLHARNCYQILGEDLSSPVDFVICWTPGGEEKGGTAQAIRIAKSYNIKIFNLAVAKDYDFWKEKICQKA